MEKIVSETNSKLESIISALNNVKTEYEKKLETNQKNIDGQLEKVRSFKTEYETTKERIEQYKKDIKGFEEDYQSLVNRFKDDELSSILVAANKEITLKVEDRKKKILKDKTIMNTLLAKANKVKSNLVILTSEKKALDIQCKNISDAYEFYNTSLTEIIEFSNNNSDNILSYFKKDFSFDDKIIEEKNDIDINDHIFDDFEDTLFDEIYEDDDFNEELESTNDIEENIEDLDLSDIDLEDLDLDLSNIDLEDIILDDFDDDNIEENNTTNEDNMINTNENNDELDNIIINNNNNNNKNEINFDDIIIDEDDNNTNIEDFIFNTEIANEEEDNEINIEDIINIDDIEDDDELFN